MPQSFASLTYHIIFSTKARFPALTGEMVPRLYDYIGGILKPHDGVLLAAGGMPDHVHLLTSLGRETSVAVAVRLIKTNSSKWIHDTFPEQRSFAWQTGYGAFTVSHSNLPSVKSYIAGQVEPGAYAPGY